MVVDTFKKLKAESGDSSEGALRQLRYLRAMYAPALFNVTREQLGLSFRFAQGSWHAEHSTTASAASIRGICFPHYVL